MATIYDYTAELGNTITLSAGDTLSFGARSAAKVSFLQVGTDVAVQYYGIIGVETVYLLGATLSTLDAAQFTFISGESISVFGTIDIVSGEIVGTDFTDVITSGTGDQLLFGGAGDDTYVFSKGDGADIIDDFDNTIGGNVDTISFTDVVPSDITNIPDSILRDGFNLILKYGVNDQITVNNYFDLTSSNQVIEQIQFSDGTIWTETDIKNLAVTYGTGSADIIDGYNGGTNTIFSLDGDDIINGGDQYDELDGGLGNDSISGAGGADNIIGNDGNDLLIGDAGDDLIYGDAGNDSIIGGIGNDTLSDNGGNDTYTFTVGDGIDTIDDFDTTTNADKIVFTNVASTAATLERHGDNLVILYGVNDSVTVTNYFLSTDNTIETIQFSNASFSVADVNVNLTIVGTEGADTIYAPDGQDNTILGLGGDDAIVGGNQVDFIGGGAGKDSISGSAGDDFIQGGLGDDFIAGDAGNDALDGGDGNDTILGVDGLDILTGAAGDDTLLGGADDDQLFGDDGNDALSGDAGLDILSGGLGNDLLDGGSEDDLLVGEDGDDTLIGGTGVDLLFGDLGNDTYQFTAGDGVDVIDDLGGNIDTVVFTNVSYASAIVTRINQDLQIAYGTGNSDVVTITNYFTGTANLIEIFQFSDQTLTAAQVKALIPTPTNTITGTVGPDSLNGIDSTYNIINGLAGDDTINGGDLADTIDGGDGIDQVSGNAGSDSITGGAGNDYLAGDAGNDTLSGGEGNDELHGGAGDDVLVDVDVSVGGGISILYGEDGNDTFTAAFGNKDLLGGTGDDLYNIVNAPSTTLIVVEDDAGLNDEIKFNFNQSDISAKVRQGDHLLLSYGAGGNSKVAVFNYFLHPDNLIEKISFQDGSFWDESDVKNLVETFGTAGADVITGYNGAGNTIFALAGNDTITGGDLSDLIQGDEGDDQISGNAGDDSMSGDLGNDYLSGDAGNDTLDGGDGLDTLVGGDGNDSLVGWIGADNLNGGNGDDTLNGDEGLDVVSGGAGDDTISGGADADYLAGDEGNDTVYGDDGDDGLLGGLGDDTLNGDAGNDQIYGGDGADSVYGSLGLDTITGGLGNDYLNGADGNDTYVFVKGDGLDAIEDAEIAANVDTVIFSNVQSTEVTSLTSVGNDLVMVYGTGDQLTIKNYFLNNLYVVEQFTFSDGVTWTQETINTPLFTAFAAPVASGNEDAVIPVTFASLLAEGNETAPFYAINAFVIKAVSTGTLTIGTSEGTATAWNALTNNTVDATHIAYWTPSADANGTLNAFTAVAKDSAGYESSTEVQATVAVTAVNDAPVLALFDVTGAITEQVAPTVNITDSGTIAFTDVDVTDTHTVSVTATSLTPLGTLTPTVTTDTTGTGLGGLITWSYSVAASAIEYLSASETKVETFTITLVDGNGGLVDRTISVTITGTNDVPVVAAADVTGAVTEVVPASGNLTDSGTITFTDVDLTDTHSISVTSTSTTPLGTLTPTVTTDTTGTGTGGVITWSYSVVASVVSYLAAGETKIETFTITLLDGNGGSEARTVSVTITGAEINSLPVVAAIDVTGAVTELVTPTANITDSGTITFTDVDVIDVHSVSVTATSATPLGTLTPTVTTDTTGTGLGGVISWNYSVAASAVEYLAATQTKVETFTITLDDGNGGTVDRTISVTITGTNDVPVVAATDVTGAVTELVSPSGNITDSGTITFTDVDLTDTHSISVTSTSTTPLGTLTPTVTTDTTGTGTGGVITWNYSVAASAVEYLAATQTKVETFTITLDDGNGGTVDRTVSVTITGTNDVPVVAATDVTGAVTELVSPTGNITDSGTIAFTDVDLTDTHSVSVTATSATPLGTLTPTVTTDTTGTGLGGVISWNYSVAASAVEYLAATQTKVETFTITLLDGNGGTVDRTVSVTITGTNDVPVVAATDVTGAVTELVSPTGNITDSGTIAFTDVDLTDTHSVSVTATSATPLGTLTPTVTTDTTGTGLGGVISWNYSLAASAVEYLAATQTKVETFTITLDDGNGGTVDRTVSVTITGTNDVPVVAATDVTGAVTELVSPTGNITDSGTITFTDVDLTDTHSISVTSTSTTPLGTLTPTITTDTTGTGLGGVITWNYSVAASAVEYLAATQTKVETFTITLDDGNGGTVDRTVSVTITGTNDVPVVAATDVTGAVTELVSPTGNITDSGTIAFTDVDLTDTHSISVTSTSASPLGTLTPTITTDTNGTGLGGVITWGYSVAASAVAYLASGETKVETFTITLIDGNGGSVDRTVSITITGIEINALPVVAATDVTGAVTELVTPTANITDSGTIAFTDVNVIDVHSVSVTATSATPLGTLTPTITTDTTGTGLGGVITWNYSVAASAVEYLAATQTKVETFTITLLDGNGGTVDRTVSVTITGTNDVPVVAATDVTGAVTELVTPTANITDSGTIAFTDVDLTDSHTVSVTATSATPLGTLTPTITTDTNGTGLGGVITWNYSVAASAVEYLAATQTKVETFTITLLDGNGGTVDRTVSVTITGTNDVPVVAATDVTGAVTELVSPTGNITDSGTIAFTDVDLTDSHSVSVTATSATPLGTLTPTITTDTNGTGTGGIITWSYSVAASAVEYLAANQTKVETFTITLNDGRGGTVARTVSVTITGTNDAPIAVNDILAASQDTAITYTAAQLLANDTDVDTATTLTIFSVTSGSNGTAVLNGNGTVTFTPNASFTGEANFTYIATDGSAQSNSATVTVNVASISAPQTFYATTGNDTFTGTGSNDTVAYSGGSASGATAGVIVSLASQPNAQNTIGSGTDTLSGIENLIGSNFADRLTGDANNNRLAGGLASDTLTGGAGNDTFVVNITSAGALEDTVVEAAGAGTDTLVVQGTFASNRAVAITAPANVEVIDISATGSSRLNITASSTVTNTTFIGNAAANALTGSRGDDIFTGGAGADILNGGNGTNIYNVNLTNAGALEDSVTGGTGLDTILVTGASGNANATTLTAGSTIERYDISGTFSSKLNLTGNTLSNLLTGNAADNIINGGSGVDTMVGGLGNDTYVVDNIGDVITENADQGTADLVNSGITFSLLVKGINIEKLTLTGTTAINGTGNNGDNLLTGNSAINILIGNDGNDILIGKAGSDNLTGGLGVDTFWFDTTTNASTNRDTITDFVSGTDKLQFSQSVMTALGSTGQFTANDQRFWSSNTGVAHDTSDRLIFNTSTGVLSYDSDGTGRNTAVAVELIGGTAPIATDIFVV